VLADRAFCVSKGATALSLWSLAEWQPVPSVAISWPVSGLAQGRVIELPVEDAREIGDRSGSSRKSMMSLVGKLICSCITGIVGIIWKSRSRGKGERTELIYAPKV
jgi:hypothetical protein